MPSIDPASPEKSAAPRMAPARAIATRLRGELDYGALVVRAAQFEPPPPDARVRLFVYGFALPFAMLAAVSRDPGLRARYTRVIRVQLAVFVPFALLLVFTTDDVDRALRKAGASVTARTFALVAAVLGTLKAAEWIVIALSRRYHEHLATEAAILTGAPYEPPKFPPGIAVDFRWMWKRLKRKARSMFLFASGLPIFYALDALTGGHQIVNGVLVGLWAAYWSGVFVLAGSHLPWQDASPGAPWFVRSVARVGAVPIAGGPFRLYARAWQRVTASVHAPCDAFEKGPYEAAGLALARTILSLPGVYLVVRPLIGVAATHAFLARFAARTAAVP